MLLLVVLRASAHTTGDFSRSRQTQDCGHPTIFQVTAANGNIVDHLTGPEREALQDDREAVQGTV
jgi:hypothetical protein